MRREKDVSKNILVLDIGGTHIKVRASGQDSTHVLDSGKHLTPTVFVNDIRRQIAGWHYDLVSIGYPGAVGADGPTGDAANLGPGWVGYDFERAFDAPVRILNDAAMQALGAYEGNRMLFLALGTALGSTLVAERVLIPLELGDLPFAEDETLAERLGKDGLEKHGRANWMAALMRTVDVLRRAVIADYVLLGGGHANMVTSLPEHTRCADSNAALVGGVRLWEDRIQPHDDHAPAVWRVVM